MTRVFVVAETRLYREGLAQLLSSRPGFEVVGTAESWGAAAPPVAAREPEILLLDMATMHTADTIRRIAASEPAPRVVALAIPNDDRHVVAIAEAGVSGYVTRDDSFETMIEAIETVARGELLCTPRVAAVLLERVRTLARAASPGGCRRLTRRENEIVDLIDQGLSNKAIAGRLFIEPATVKNHVHNILDKLQVSRRADAPARARSARLYY